jgi:hypothetical protein
MKNKTLTYYSINAQTELKNLYFLQNYSLNNHQFFL